MTQGFWLSEEIREVEREFGVKAGSVKSMVRWSDGETCGNNSEMVSFDIDQLFDNPNLDRVRAALDFLAPVPTSDEDDEWGEYACIVPVIKKDSCGVKIASPEEAMEILLDPAWCKDQCTIVEVLGDAKMWGRLMSVAAGVVAVGQEADLLLRSMFDHADSLGYLEILVDIFEALARTPLRRIEVIAHMLSVLSRRVLLIRSQRTSSQVFNCVRNLLIDGAFLAELKAFDPPMKCLRRWLACQATRSSLSALLPHNYDFDVLNSR